MRYVLCISFLYFFQLVFGQEQVRKLTIGLTANSYRGELEKNFNNFNGGLHIEFFKLKEKAIQTSLEANIGSVSGNNYFYNLENTHNQYSNTYFKTNYFSFSFHIRAYILNKEKLKIYASQGVGFLRFIVLDENKKNLLEQKSTRKEGETYSPITAIFPTSFGVIYVLKNGFSLDYSLSYLSPQTDYIDNISKLGDKKKDKIMQFQFGIGIPLKNEIKKDPKI